MLLDLQIYGHRRWRQDYFRWVLWMVVEQGKQDPSSLVHQIEYPKKPR